MSDGEKGLYLEILEMTVGRGGGGEGGVESVTESGERPLHQAAMVGNRLKIDF